MNSCTGERPARRAGTTANFERQQAKIVNAINTMDADIVSLEEIENSRKVDDITDRDEAVDALVDALNADAGPGPLGLRPVAGRGGPPAGRRART